MIQRVLVANRGEIARRICRACREVGVQSVVPYSEPDAHGAWLADADLAVPLAGVTAAETYLNADALLAIARRHQAEALHPGYGFLSENADFAEACQAAGVTFVGPSPAAMRRLGSKVGAREAATAAGVPTMPGVDGRGRTVAELEQAATRLGYPVLVKASAGGGGRGMRIVRRAEEFADLYQAAEAESVSAFGSDHMLLEQYFERARHIEVQVLGDLHGQVLHFFERECSIQRRHQKIIEESPAIDLAPETRRAMTDAAVALAREVGYASAGTVEFLVDAEEHFYLLEMNTRLQVEHPVTELVTGADLVAWQLRIAGGAPLLLSQDDIRQRGHAIECRVYAEDPARDFLPSVGTVAAYLRPSGPGIRVDDGLATGSQISPYYDAMVAKVIAHAGDREAARRRMVLALADLAVLGITTNVPYLQAILDHPRFIAGDTTTRFLDEAMNDWRPDGAPPTDDDWLILAAYEALVGVQGAGHGGSPGAPGTASGDLATDGAGGRFEDPWASHAGWRNVR